MLEVAFRRFALQPALLFSQKGERLEAATAVSGFAGVSGAEMVTVNRFNWLELPVSVVCALRDFQVFAGPSVALGVGGRERSTLRQASPTARFGPYEFSRTITYGSDTENRRLDAGVNFGLGYRKGPLQVQAGYGLGLRNLHRQFVLDGLIFGFLQWSHNFNADRAYNRVTQLTATHFFEL